MSVFSTCTYGIVPLMYFRRYILFLFLCIGGITRIHPIIMIFVSTRTIDALISKFSYLLLRESLVQKTYHVIKEIKGQSHTSLIFCSLTLYFDYFTYTIEDDDFIITISLYLHIQRDRYFLLRIF